MLVQRYEKFSQLPINDFFLEVRCVASLEIFTLLILLAKINMLQEMYLFNLLRIKKL